MNRDDIEIVHGVSEQGKSRSQKKRESAALQEMGETLAGLAPGILDEFGLPADLDEAIRDLRAVKKHEARRRQMQLIGRRMRELDDAEHGRIAALLERQDKRREVESDALHRLEELRATLLDENRREAALLEMAVNYPSAEIKKLRHLAEMAAAERNGGKGVKAFRELFRYLSGL